MKQIEVVAAIIIKGHKLFATQRGYGEFKGLWEMPGGKIEQGETKEEALMREIREELDTKISVGQLVRTIEYDYPDFHLTMHCFAASVVEGKLTLLEHEDARWLDASHLESVEWLPADYELLDDFRKLLSAE